MPMSGFERTIRQTCSFHNYGSWCPNEHPCAVDRKPEQLGGQDFCGDAGAHDPINPG